MFLAWRNLLKDKTRLALTVGGVALAVMLILLLGGFLAATKGLRVASRLWCCGRDAFPPPAARG